MKQSTVLLSLYILVATVLVGKVFHTVYQNSLLVYNQAELIEKQRTIAELQASKHSLQNQLVEIQAIAHNDSETEYEQIAQYYSLSSQTVALSQ